MQGAAVTLLLLALVGAASAIAPVTNATGGWRQGRATFYGGSQQYLQNFPDRGPAPEYGFGTPLYGSCGYLSQAGTEGVDFSNVPFPVDMLSAVANINDDYPGSCGRCYEIKCDTGVVIGNYSAANNDAVIPYNTATGFTEPGLNYTTLVDDYGRTWNGNPLMSEDQLFTQCWNVSQALGLTNLPDNSIYVHVTDNCPCLQYDDDSTTITGDNPPCCGNVNHFDLSYYGFEKLAHPNYGLMNLEFRPVDCYTKVPLDYLPGYINETIYGDNIESGWAWYPYQQNNKQLQVQGAGVGGSNATCIDVNSEGGISFVSRLANTAGYQPFLANNATTLSFYVKTTSAADIGTGSGVPSTVTVSIGNSEMAYYCTGLTLSSLTVGDVSNGMSHLTVPISQFDCNLALVDELGFQNTGTAAVQFCLDDIALTGGSPADPHIMTGSADLMAGRAGEGLLPGSLATGRPPAWGLNAVSAVGSHSLASVIAQVPWAEGTEEQQATLAKSLLASSLLSQGTAIISQDAVEQPGLAQFVGSVVQLRRTHAALLQPPGFTSSRQLRWHGATTGSEPDWVGEAAASGYHAASFIGYSLQQPGEPSIYVAYNPYDYPMRIDIPDPPSGHMWRQAMDTSDSAPLSTTLDVKAYPALHVQTQYDIQAKAAIALLSTPVS